jgi:hypothetical protein
MSRSAGEINGTSPSIPFFPFCKVMNRSHLNLSFSFFMTANMTMAESYLTQKLKAFASLARKHPDGKTERYEQVSPF